MKYTAVFLFTYLFGYYSSINGQSLSLKEVGHTASSELKPGIPAFEKKSFKYLRDDKPVFLVKFKQPVLIEMASKPEKWGFYQFPSIYLGQDKIKLISKWSLAADNIKSYGKGGHAFAVSKDGGKNWTKTERAPLGGGLLLPNGDRISIHTPAAWKISDLAMPPVIQASKENYGGHLLIIRLKTCQKICVLFI